MRQKQLELYRPEHHYRQERNTMAQLGIILGRHSTRQTPKGHADTCIRQK